MNKTEDYSEFRQYEPASDELEGRTNTLASAAAASANYAGTHLELSALEASQALAANLTALLENGISDQTRSPMIHDAQDQSIFGKTSPLQPGEVSNSTPRQTVHIRKTPFRKEAYTDSHHLFTAGAAEITEGEYHLTPQETGSESKSGGGINYYYEINRGVTVIGGADTVVHGARDFYLDTARGDPYYFSVNAPNLDYFFTGGTGNNTFFTYGGINYIDLSHGGNNTVYANAAWNIITGGDGNDHIEITNHWNNPGHSGNWSRAEVSLTRGGDNTVIISGGTVKVDAGRHNDKIEVRASSNNSPMDVTINLIRGGNNHVEISDASSPVERLVNVTLGFGNDTIVAGIHSIVNIDGSQSAGDDTIILNSFSGEISTGYGSTEITISRGTWEFFLGAGSHTIEMNGQSSLASMYDPAGRLIIDSLLVQPGEVVYTFSAIDNFNISFSLEMGHRPDTVQFYAQTGTYSITSSGYVANTFQFDFLGGSSRAEVEVFNFRWGTDRILTKNGTSMEELLFTDGSSIRAQYIGLNDGAHAVQLVAVEDIGAYQEGNIFATLYSSGELPPLDFLL